jgi:4-amino-4-deoxy-L-arabinose transferase-like glycosyltransferase
MQGCEDVQMAQHDRPLGVCPCLGADSYLYQVWRITLGEMPYRDFLTPQQPIFLFSGATVMHLLGLDMLSVRAVGVVLILVAGLFVCLIGQELISLQAGLIAMSLFLLHPDVYRWGRMYRPEAYMLCLSTGALYVYILVLRRSRWNWLWLSGVLFGLSTEFCCLADACWRLP